MDYKKMKKEELVELLEQNNLNNTDTKEDKALNEILEQKLDIKKLPNKVVKVRDRLNALRTFYNLNFYTKNKNLIVDSIIYMDVKFHDRQIQLYERGYLNTMTENNLYTMFKELFIECFYKYNGKVELFLEV
jgi:folate-dependent tRNA-U54 methylase TrmFO/GidA